MKKRALSTVIITVMLISLTACGSSYEQSFTDDYSSTNSYDSLDGAGVTANTKQLSGIALQNNASSTMDSYDDYSVEAEATETYEEYTENTKDETSNVNNITLLEEKLIYRCDLDIQTTDYNTSIENIRNTISKYNGIIQSERETDDSYDWYKTDFVKTRGTLHNYMEVRIPSKDYYNFINELDGVGKIISKTQNVDNISQQYYDTTASIKALKIEEERLLDMLNQCYDIEDMITVEERLSEVEYEVSRLTTELRYMDMDVAYSYVNIELDEVMEYDIYSEPVKTSTFVDRLINTVKDTWKGFLKFCENLLFTVIKLLPAAVIIGIIYIIVRLTFWKNIKASKSQKKENEDITSNSRMLMELLKYKEEENKKGKNTEGNKDEHKK